MKIYVNEFLTTGIKSAEFDIDSLNKDMLMIGRSPQCDLYLSGEGVLGEVGRIYRDESGRWILEDLNRPTGIYCDNRRIMRMYMNNGMQVVICDNFGRTCAEMFFEEKAVAPQPAELQEAEAAADVAPESSEGKGSKRKSKAPLIAIISACAVVCIAAVILIICAAKGTFKSKSSSVLDVVANSLDGSKLAADCKGVTALFSDSFNCTVNVGQSGTGSGTVTVAVDGKDAYAALDADVDITGKSYAAKVAFIDGEVMLTLPGDSENVYTYNYKDHANGEFMELIGSDSVEAIDNFLKTLDNSETLSTMRNDMLEIVAQDLSSLDISEVDKKECNILGKNRKCKGYKVKITKADVTKLVDDLQAYTDGKMNTAIDPDSEYAEDIYEEYEEIYDDLKDELEDAKDFSVDLTFYMYNEYLAYAELDTSSGYSAELKLEGENYPLENSSLIMTYDGGDYVNTVTVSITGYTDASEEHLSMKINDVYKNENGDYDEDNYDIFDLTYNYKERALKINCDDDFSMEATIDSTDSSFGLSVESLTVDGKDIAPSEASIKITSGGNIEKISGTEVDISSLTESEAESIAQKLESLYSSQYPF